LDVKTRYLAIDSPRLIFEMQSQGFGIATGDLLPRCSQALKRQVADMVWHCAHRFKCRDVDAGR
jgi:hypothetical protein